MLSTDKNDVILDGKIIYQTRHRIKKLLVFGERYILLEESPIGLVYNQNVSAISPEGELLWVAETRPPLSGAVDNPYLDVWEADGQLWVGNWVGWTAQLDPVDGHILQKVYTK